MFIKCWFENDISQHYKTSSNNNSPQTMGLWWLDGTTVSMDDLSPPGPGALMMFHLPNGNSTRHGESNGNQLKNSGDAAKFLRVPQDSFEPWDVCFYVYVPLSVTYY